jgi:hypothetical protein
MAKQSLRQVNNLDMKIIVGSKSFVGRTRAEELLREVGFHCLPSSAAMISASMMSACDTSKVSKGQSQMTPLSSMDRPGSADRRLC